jgi:hypothetical protein
MAEERKWSGFMSRTTQKITNNLGVVSGKDSGKASSKYRRKELEDLDAYYENRQYDHLMNWEAASQMKGDEYVPIRKRKPRIVFAFGKLICQRVASKLVGRDTFPSFLIEEDPDTQAFLQVVVKLSKMQSRILEPVRRTLACGSGLVRFYVISGTLKMESYLSKYCYPLFNAAGELSQVEIKYCYEDPSERDQKGNPVRKWYRLTLGETVDILYNNPPYMPGNEPEFEEVSRAEHNLGFVQAVWFRTCEDKHVPDGYSIFEDTRDFIDELNYSLSQSSVSVSYNQDPQLAIKGMDADDIDELIRSSAKAWNFGRDGEGKFLESSLTGVDKAMQLRDKVRLAIQDVARVIMMDPEKMVSHAQSGRSLEILHGPMVELVNELRPMIEVSLIELLLKMAITLLALKSQGAEIGIEMPDGWTPVSLNVSASWPPIFPMTMADLKEKLAVATAASSANLVSRETMTRWIARDFAIEDVELEIQKVAAQPILNPFGAF